MAQTVYTSVNAVTQANKHLAYDRLITLLHHLGTFGVDLFALSLNPDKTVSVTLTGALPVEQLSHLGLRP